MKKFFRFTLVAVCATLAFSSCVTPSQVNYLQDMRHGSQIELENKFQAVICPYDELASSFREFGDCLGKCRYTKCTHLREEGCAVLAKRDAGGIAASRHESYVRIFEEQRSVPEWKRRQNEGSR